MIEVRVEAPGEVRLNAERVVQVRPRFPGVLRTLSRRLGDPVRSGEVLAVVHSNESLTEYEVPAPQSGTVVAREAAEGQAVDGSTVLYTIADLSTVWVDFALYPQIATRVRRGQPVRIRSGASAAADAATASGTVSYVGPLLEQDTRVSYGRVVLANAGNAWPPGLFVRASIAVDRARVAVAVPEEAIVRMAAGPAVFIAADTMFTLQPITTGRSDGDWTEVVAGLEPGTAVAVRNAYLLKAELGKGEATHEH
jgi:cobalt-zinc-cadmium efflux system membrane fusion protein